MGRRVSTRDESADLLLPGRGMARTAWVAIPEWILLAAISPNAVVLYGVLGAHVNHSRTLPDGTADRRSWPGQARMGEMLGWSASKVKRALAELVALDAVAVSVVRWGPNRMKRRNLYTVHLDAPRGYTGAKSVTYWTAQPQVTPVGSDMTPPVGSDLTHQPDVVTPGTEIELATPPARRHAPRDGESADREPQKALTERIEELRADGEEYESAVILAVVDVLDAEGVQTTGPVAALIDSMTDRGEVPARILNTARKYAEEDM